MNEAHFHLLWNHLPIIIPIVGILILASGVFLKSEILKRTAFLVFILGALCAVPALLTGEGAEEVVENLPGVSEDYIHTHEEIAEKFAFLSYLLGGLSVLGLWANWKRKAFSGILTWLILLVAAIVLFLGAQTGLTGGEIMHSEIRTGQSAPSIATPEPEEKD